MIKEQLIVYFASKLFDEGVELVKEKITELQSQATAIAPESGELPSVCLVGFGRCGTRICSNVRDILLESRSTEELDNNDDSLFSNFIAGL